MRHRQRLLHRHCLVDKRNHTRAKTHTHTQAHKQTHTHSAAIVNGSYTGGWSSCNVDARVCRPCLDAPACNAKPAAPTPAGGGGGGEDISPATVTAPVVGTWMAPLCLAAGLYTSARGM